MLFWLIYTIINQIIKYIFEDVWLVKFSGGTKNSGKINYELEIN